MIDYLNDNLVKAEALARKVHVGQVDKAVQLISELDKAPLKCR